jgi:predicted RecB family endonuclease
MTLFVTKAVRRYKGKTYEYFVLKRNVWDRAIKAQRQEYVQSLGKRPVLSLKKARKLAKKLGIELEELQRVRGLKIVS